MATKTRLEFSNHDDWLAYIDAYVPASERAYALAAGRTELLKRFYELRNWQFPVEFALELSRIHDREEMESSADLELLNRRMFANLTTLLFNHSEANASRKQSSVAQSPRARVLELRDYITNANPYFQLWMHFKSVVASTAIAPSWAEYLVQCLGSASGEEFEFAQAMAELDKLLVFFHDANLDLPRFSFERVWFLHYLQPPERMLQTRSVLTLLTAEVEACTSA